MSDKQTNRFAFVGIISGAVAPFFACQVLPEVQNYMVNVSCAPFLPVIKIHYPTEVSVRPKWQK